MSKTCGLCLWMVLWWLLIPVQMGVTALLPIALFPLMGIISGEYFVSQPYFGDSIMVFLGSLLIATSIEEHGLHCRFANSILYWTKSFGDVGLLFAFIITTGSLSMWLSNSATAALMTPMAKAVFDTRSEDLSLIRDCGIKIALDLEIAYAASIGGMATLTGTGSNLVLKATMESIWWPLRCINWSSHLYISSPPPSYQVSSLTSSSSPILNINDVETDIRKVIPSHIERNSDGNECIATTTSITGLNDNSCYNNDDIDYDQNDEDNGTELKNNNKLTTDICYITNSSLTYNANSTTKQTINMNTLQHTPLSSRNGTNGLKTATTTTTSSSVTKYPSSQLIMRETIMSIVTEDETETEARNETRGSFTYAEYGIQWDEGYCGTVMMDNQRRARLDNGAGTIYLFDEPPFITDGTVAMLCGCILFVLPRHPSISDEFEDVTFFVSGAYFELECHEETELECDEDTELECDEDTELECDEDTELE
eukprot:gene8776-18150_t